MKHNYTFSPAPSQEHLSGLVERVTFHNPDNGYCVLRVKVRGYKDLLTVVGHASTISAGEFIHASGQWINNREYGSQFKAQFLKATPPTTEEGIEKYLASGMIKGIGPVYAKRLVEAFKSSVFDIIEEDPQRLQTVEGIGPHRASLIAKGWADQKAIREIMLFLHSHGVSTSRAVRIYKTFGDSAIQIITENPYELAKRIRGIGFISADKIAERVGIKKDSLIRAKAGLSHVLLEAMEEGHCGLPQKVLLTQAEKLLGISSPILLEALESEIVEGNIIKDCLEDIKEEGSFLKGLYQAEQNIAHLLKDQAEGPPPWKTIEAEKAIPWVEAKLGISLSQSQKEAVEKALSSKVLIITGGPGVGKTTLVKSLLTILKAKDINTFLSAPTGRAAKRLSEATGLEARTIHRLLEIDPISGNFKKGASSLLKC